MAEFAWTRQPVPYGADQTTYVVVDICKHGKIYQEIEIERADFEAALTDLLSGQFNEPIRVVAFNTLEHWSKDISVDVAREIQCRCDMDGSDVPQYLASFMETHIGSRRGPAAPVNAGGISARYHS
jgi:hypothetical protein